jgi:uncharacterized protein (TIGR02679 family)
MTDRPSLPAALRAHLDVISLSLLWTEVRARLERSGHAIRGVITIELDDDAADRLAGLLARPVGAGTQRIKLADLDTALRQSAAGCGLVATIAELSGQPLRDRPAERLAARDDWQRVWQQLDDDLVRAELAQCDWAARWTQWLHASGVVTRLGAVDAIAQLRAAVAVLALVAPALDPGFAPSSMRALGELASRATGSAHGLDDGRTTPALVLRAAAIALERPPPESSAERRALWQRLGVEPDLISGTVMVWALRPPGADAWSAMMRDRAAIGLVTHLTIHELRRFDGALTAPGAAVHGCENPQVLQALADAGVDQPLACLSGNPSAAGLALAARVSLHYHGDFDWPGIAIAGRHFAAGAQPWRMTASDYLSAVESQRPTARLTLTGHAEPTPWDHQLSPAMARLGVAVHEESIIDTLLTDLSPR